MYNAGVQLVKCRKRKKEMHICTLYKEMQIHLFDLTITLTPMYPGPVPGYRVHQGIFTMKFVSKRCGTDVSMCVYTQ